MEKLIEYLFEILSVFIKFNLLLIFIKRESKSIILIKDIK
jgi:hypothetical protein